MTALDPCSTAFLISIDTQLLNDRSSLLANSIARCLISGEMRRFTGKDLLPVAGLLISQYLSNISFTVTHYCYFAAILLQNKKRSSWDTARNDRFSSFRSNLFCLYISDLFGRVNRLKVWPNAGLSHIGIGDLAQKCFLTIAGITKTIANPD